MERRTPAGSTHPFNHIDLWQRRLWLLATIFLSIIAIFSWLNHSLQAATMPQAAAAQEGMLPTYTGHIGGAAASIAAAGSSAYVTFGPEFAVLDVTTPEAPTRTGYLLFPKTLNAVAHSGTVAVAVDTSVRIIDVSDGSAPQTVKNLHPGMLLRDVTIDGALAYVVGGDANSPTGRLFIFDISNPAQSSQLSSYELSGVGHGVAVSGTHVFSALAGLTMEIHDVADPAAPTFVADVALNGRGKDVAIVGHYAYVLVNDCAVNCTGGLEIFDISDLEAISQIGFIPLPVQPSSILIDGSTAYIANGQGGLHRFDLSNPASPAAAGVLSSDASLQDVAVIGTTVFAAAGVSGVVTFDTVGGLVETGRFPTSATVLGVAATESMAFVADEAGMRIVDTTNGATPAIVGSVDTEQRVHGVAVSGTVAYLANDADGVRLIDISTPAAPVELGHYNTPGIAYSVAVSGAYAYVADGLAGLRVLDVSNAALPMEVGAVDTSGEARFITIRGAYAYIADWDRGLRIIDISDPEDPVEVGFYNTPGESQGVAIQGDYAYVADNLKGIRIIDISDPTLPFEAASFVTQRFVRQVAVSGPFAYIANDDFGLKLIDITQPTAPQDIGDIETAGRAWAVAAQPNGALFVGDWIGGLLIYDHAIFSVAGIVYQANGQPFSGADIELSGVGSNLSDSQGSYQFEALPNGSYLITPSLADHVFDPPWINVDLPPSLLDANFAILRAPLATVVTAGVTETIDLLDTQPTTTTFTVPAMALSQTATLILTPTTGPRPDALNYAGHSFDIGLEIGGVVESDVQFDAPISVQLAYSDADAALVGQEDSLKLYWYDGIEWVPAEMSCPSPSGQTIDLLANQVTVEICMTGRYALLGSRIQLFLPVATVD